MIQILFKNSSEQNQEGGGHLYLNVHKNNI